jgi:hypothetical protein
MQSPRRRPRTKRQAEHPSLAPLANPYHSWLRMHAKPPDVLYHYTTAQGLLGILKTGSLWATNSRFLNDPTEIEYATQLFRRIADEEFGKYGSPSPTHVAYWQKCVASWLDYYEQEAKVYVACFSADGDLLSQWRGYGATGGGYAIGFATTPLPQSQQDVGATPGFAMRRVIYNPNTQEGLVRERVKALCEPGKTSSRDQEGWFSTFFSECLNCFKHPAFEEEREWRAIQFGRQAGRDISSLKFDFRTSLSRIIDYTQLNLKATDGKFAGKLPISAVCYGPTLDAKTTERSLKILLGAHGYDVGLVHIKRSKVPFTG